MNCCRVWVGFGMVFLILFADSERVHSQAPKATPPKVITNSIGMKLILIPEGRFVMGSPPEDQDADPDELPHLVLLTKYFYLGETEVTQRQWQQVMQTNPSYFQKPTIQVSDSSDYPVDSVLWEDAVRFCRALSALPEEKEAGRKYRLPTEAEWEYACRAGSTTPFSFGDDADLLENYAWYSDNSDRQTHPVAQKKPNAWGLYDMHGNVWEWCSDWYGDYPTGQVSDPAGRGIGLGRVYRGGCWCFGATMCRSAFRCRYYPSDLGNDYGLRIAVDISPLKLFRNGK